MSEGSAAQFPARSSHRLVRAAFAEALFEAIDFLFGEARKQACLARDGRRRFELDFAIANLLLHLADLVERGSRAEGKHLIDAVLERLRLLEALGVALGQLAHPFRAHPHMSDLVGE